MESTQNKQPSAGGNPRAHNLVLTGRERVELCGVEEVISFDETCVVLSTSMGELTVEGSGFRMGTLNMEQGIVIFTGSVSGMVYAVEDPRGNAGNGAGKKGLFGRFLR